MSSTVQKRDLHYIHHIIVLIIIFGAHLIPTFSTVTREGVVILGSFIGAVYGWSTINMLWPSIMAIFSVGLVKGMNAMIAASLGNGTTWMLMLFFIIVGYLNNNNIPNTLSSFIMTRKIFSKNPYLLFFGFFIGAYICAFLSGAVAVIFFCTVAFSACEVAGVKPHTKTPTLLGIGVVISALMMSVTIPFKSTGLMITSAWTTTSGIQVDYLSWMAISFIITLLVMVWYLIICKVVFRIDTTPFKGIDNEKLGIKFEGFTKQQKIGFGVLLWVVADILCASVLPSDFILTKFLIKIGAFGQVLIPLTVAMFIRVDGEPVIDFQKIAAKHFPWDVLFLIGYIMILSSYMMADSTGLKAFIVELISPLTNLGLFGFLLVLFAIITALTNFANNAVCCLAVLPIIYAYTAIDSNLNGTAAVFALLMVSHFAFLTPGATPMAALMIGRSDWVKSNMIWKYGLIIIVLLFIVMVPAAYLLGTIVF
ncbi:MAG: anion permease [Peptococcaceae bacterium]|nr:anion permease [Peptococcaceae bacterium]